jgi:hypothetical protein
VERLIEKLFLGAKWVEAGHRYQGAEDELKLLGWTRSRRVIITRRKFNGDIVLVNEAQLSFTFIGAFETLTRHEYAVLVTDLPYEITQYRSIIGIALTARIVLTN